MAAKFVLKKGSTGKFRFNLLATNGQVIATSEAYETKRAALGGIDSVRKNAGDAEIDDLTGGGRSAKPTNEKAAMRREQAQQVSDEDRAAEDEPEQPRDEGGAEHDGPSGDADTGATDDAGDTKAEAGDTEDDEPEPMAPPVDQTPALRNDGALNLGLCYFGGAEEPASLVATRKDGTGWIAVCDKHTKDAEEQGFEVQESSRSDGDG